MRYFFDSDLDGDLAFMFVAVAKPCLNTTLILEGPTPLI